jgi:hypothetical protein
VPEVGHTKACRDEAFDFLEVRLRWRIGVSGSQGSSGCPSEVDGVFDACLDFAVRNHTAAVGEFGPDKVFDLTGWHVGVKIAGYVINPVVNA